MSERNRMGDQSTLIVDGEPIPVTDKGWTYTKETASSQFDDSRAPDRGISGESPEGDLEYDGAKKDLETRLIEAENDKHRIIYRFNDGGGFRFKRCIITDIEASSPGDGKRNVSISWEGEEAVPF